MKYEISDEDFTVIKRACIVAYTVLADESPDVRSAPMQEIQAMFNRLEAQRGAAEEEGQEPAAADVSQGTLLLVQRD